MKEPLLKLDPGILCKWEEWSVYMGDFCELRVSYTARILEKPLPEHLRAIPIQSDDSDRPILSVVDFTLPTAVGEPEILTFAWVTFYVSTPVSQLGQLIADLRSGAVYTKKNCAGLVHEGERKI